MNGAGFTHTLCEVCWFGHNPGRFPVQIVRAAGDTEVDRCCLCDSVKVTRIWARFDPNATGLICRPGAHD